MKTTWIPPIISKILGIKNVAWDQINPATEETAQAIAAKKIGDSFWLKNVLSAVSRLVVDGSGQLRAVVAGTVAISSGTITTVSTVTQSNTSIGDSWKTATILSQSNANFQGGARRLIRKI